MVIHFKLAWLKPGASILKAFKMPASAALFREYSVRIARFGSCKTSGSLKEFAVPAQGCKRWICDPSAEAERPSSEGLAKKIQTLERSGVRELEILIGGPDGFSPAEIKKLAPDMRWSFGPLTLPHELGAIVASEQIYRAYTILHNHPYHQGH